MSEITGNDGSMAAPAMDPMVDPAAPTTPRSYKVKVDGNEMDVTEEDLISGYQLNRVSQQRMQEAATERKLAQEVMSLFKNNPKEAMAKLGMDAKVFAEQVLNEHINEAMLTPEQKEQRDMRKRLDEFETKARTEKERAESEAREKFEQETTEQLQADIIGALSSSDLPKNPYTVGRMAYYMDAMIRAGYPQVSAKDVVGRVRQEYHEQVKSVMSSYDKDKLLDFLGDDLTKTVVQQHLNKTKQKQKQPEPSRVGVKLTPQQKEQATTPGKFFRGDRYR